MIIRENKDTFIMIEQHNHAEVSADMMANWDFELNIEFPLTESVHYAIRNHDVGWRNFDKQPFWDDKEKKPYDFNSFPLAAKMIIYQHGINEVEKQDLYAGLLCSVHYSNFLVGVKFDDAKAFVKEEKNRQKRLTHQLGGINKRLFEFHYDLLKFADSLSLFLCLNEPGTKKENHHYFFKNGIRMPKRLSEDNATIEWKGKDAILLNPFPFKNNFSVELKQKEIPKHEIQQDGLIHTYENTPFQQIPIQILSK